MSTGMCVKKKHPDCTRGSWLILFIVHTILYGKREEKDPAFSLFTFMMLVRFLGLNTGKNKEQCQK